MGQAQDKFLALVTAPDGTVNCFYRTRRMDAPLSSEPLRLLQSQNPHLMKIPVIGRTFQIAILLGAQCAMSGNAIAQQPVRAPGSHAGMVRIEGWEFAMGAADPRGRPHAGREAMEDARPVHRVSVHSFWIDKTDVTNAQFARFVKATGYVTVAERAPQAQDAPDASPSDMVPGAIVFTWPQQPVSLSDPYAWWKYVPGANWRHPLGPKSTIVGHDHDPVVQVAYDDAQAYAKWAGKRLPTEAEWEFAARGRLEGKLYVWGDALNPGGRWMANTFQGSFPVRDAKADGYAGIAPVGRFPPNGYGLYDMAGNVWQWTADWYRPDYYAQIAAANIVAHDPQGPASSFDPAEPGVPKRVQRGGSFLCTEQYCTRYMVGARGRGEPSSATNHVGFRCVMDDDAGSAAVPKR